MNFVEKLLGLIKDGFSFLGEIFEKLFDLISIPLVWLYYLLEGIFYFITKLFEVVVYVIMIFVALFQFFFAIVAGVIRTISSWLTVSPSPNVDFPSVSNRGFATVIDIIQPTGLVTVVPMVATAFIWLYFVIKMIGLFGGTIMVRPFGNGGAEK